MNVRKGGLSLRTFSLLKGVPAQLPNGETIGIVQDVCISPRGEVSDLVLKERGFFGRRLRMPFSDVLAFGSSRIMISKGTSPERYKERLHEYTMGLSRPIDKKKVLSSFGEELGLLEDVYFSEKLGTIVGYELTDGFFSDITSGKRIVQSSLCPQIREDAIIVSVNQLRGGGAYDEVSQLPKQGSGENRY